MNDKNKRSIKLKMLLRKLKTKGYCSRMYNVWVFIVIDYLINIELIMYYSN